MAKNNDKTETKTFQAPATTYVDAVLKMSDVTVDHKWNSRKFTNYAGPTWDKREADSNPVAKAGQSVEELSHLIKKDGLISKPIVWDKGDGEFFLVAGFRRWEAIKHLGWKEVPVRIKQMTPSEARRINLEENQARKDLTSYELAMGVAAYADALESEGATRKGGSVEGGGRAQWSSRIASELAISKSAVTLYNRIVDSVHPKILETWGDPSKPGHKLCILSRLEAWGKMPKEEQLTRFKNLVATGNEDAAGEGGQTGGGASEEGEGGGGERGTADKGPRMIKVEYALDALAYFQGEYEQEKDPSKRQRMSGIIAALKWTTGKTKQERKGKQVLGMLDSFQPFASEIQAEEDARKEKEAKAKAEAEAKAKAEAEKATKNASGKPHASA